MELSSGGKISEMLSLTLGLAYRRRFGFRIRLSHILITSIGGRSLCMQCTSLDERSIEVFLDFNSYR